MSEGSLGNAQQPELAAGLAETLEEGRTMRLERTMKGETVRFGGATALGLYLGERR